MTRKTVCTASTPSSAWTTSKPSRVSTDDTIRRRVGLSSAITTVGMTATLSSPDETAHRLHELVLVELRLQQVGAGAGLEPGALVFLAAAGGHDDDRHLLPAAGAGNRTRQCKAVHARHFHVGHDEVRRGVLESGGAVQTVDSGDHVVAGTFEDDPLQLAHTDGVLDDEHAWPVAGGLVPRGRLHGCRARDRGGGGPPRAPPPPGGPGPHRARPPRPPPPPRPAPPAQTGP